MRVVHPSDRPSYLAYEMSRPHRPGSEVHVSAAYTPDPNHATSARAGLRWTPAGVYLIGACGVALVVLLLLSTAS